MAENLAALLEQRFGVTVDVPPELARLDELVQAAVLRSRPWCRLSIGCRARHCC
jgi:hypothetical protein